MAGRIPTRQELIRRQRRSGFVGRRAELDAFRAALRQPPAEAGQFLFLLHGGSGLGKTALTRQFEAAARAAGATGARLDGELSDPVAAMGEIAAQFAAQGCPLPGFARELDRYLRRRHDLDGEVARAAAALTAGPRGGGTVAARNGPAELTPVFLHDLAEAAAARPWLLLVLDDYQVLGPVLDEWLYDLVITGRHGELPGNVLVVLAGREPLDQERWGDCSDLVSELPLQPFSDQEARQLLAGRGVPAREQADEAVRLAAGSPLLAAVLAAAAAPVAPAVPAPRPGGRGLVLVGGRRWGAGAGPADPDGSADDAGEPAEAPDTPGLAIRAAAVEPDGGDTVAAAVGRLLRAVRDPDRQALLLACALPLELDRTAWRALTGEEPEQQRAQFDWLTALPLVTERGPRWRYLEPARSVLLGLLRSSSPAGWWELHTRLADASAERRAELEQRHGPEGGCWEPGWWTDAEWRELRRGEAYHRLCADPRPELAGVLRTALEAADHGDGELRCWVRMVVRAGEDSADSVLRGWGRRLRAAAAEPGPGVLGLLISRAGYDSAGRALAYTLRGRQHLAERRFAEAVADLTAALALEPTSTRALFGRAVAFDRMGRKPEALVDLGRVVELAPQESSALVQRALTLLELGRPAEARQDLARAERVAPENSMVFVGRAVVHSWTSFRPVR
ncbi:AAA family ATPase [Kitasatospora sp. NPDC006697]|uniref:AAA family ATPase n=1 Tax=Kitasatospora sp. NPDC006697 TaxID=3364020 RepID=UPI003688ED16